jgi:PKD repeat protein
MPVAGMEPNKAFVLPNLAPKINSYQPSNLSQTLEVGQSLGFSITATDPENDPLHYSWFIDDVLFGELSSFTLTATAPLVGLHQVKGTVSDQVSGHDPLLVTWQVEITGDQGLYPDFTSNITAVCVGNSVQFTDESLGEITGWSWVFEGGNPTTSSAVNPLVLYENQGYYDVTLTISNAEQTESITMTDYIHVVGLTTVSAGADTETCQETPVLFTGIATNNSNLLWTSAGDGIFSNTSSLTTSYTPGSVDAEAGYAEITITAYPVSPCFTTSTDMLMLTVLSPPQITNQPANQSAYPGQQAIFEVEAIGSGMLEYQWYGPSGEIAGADENPFIIPEVSLEDAGEYYCIVQNGCGSEQSQPATLIILELNEQVLEIPSGWSGISSFVVPQNPMVAGIFEETVNSGSLVVLQNYSFIFWPDQSINTIDANGGWDEQQGYQIKLASAQQVAFSGINLAEKTLNYNEPGWFLLPVLNECGVAPQVLLSEVINQLVIVKEVAGMKLFWPGVYQNLWMLEPGKAYWAKFTSPVSFTYPECTTLKTENTEYPDIPLSRFVSSVNPNPQSHVFVLDEKAVSELQMSDRIVISTSGGREMGYIQIINTHQPISLELFADDPTTTITDGFLNSETIIIRIFRGDQMLVCNPQFDALWNGGNLEINGLSLIRSLKTSPVISGQDENIQFDFYPNPSGNTLVFSGIKSPFMVNIYSSQGQQVISSSPELSQLDISGLKPGVYYFVIYQNEKIISRKFIKTL